MRHRLNYRNRESILEITVRKTLWVIENFLIKINWGFFLKNHS